MPTSLRSVAGLLATTILLPLAVVALGFWEQGRGVADWAELEAERVRLSAIVEQLEARAPSDGRIDLRARFQRGGRTFVGPLALTQARSARDEAATLATVMDLRRWLPPVAIGAAGLVALLSILVLLGGALLGRLGRRSPEILVRGFALVRVLMPPVLALQVVLGAVAFVAVVVFEAAILARPGFGSDQAKMLGVAVVAVLGSLFVAGSTVVALRRALSAFEPDPLSILGRPVSPEEAPGLWRLVGGLAERLGALKPDAIVVGLTEGFFVSAGPKVLEPSGERLSGETLYVPLAYLPLLRPDEVASIIGHELAHFAGGDTAYSLRFLPIYAGVGRSLEAVAAAGVSDFGLVRPALRLGEFVMEQFHYAVRHWSRAREFEADQAGAGVTSPEAAVRALLRTSAAGPRIAETLDAAAAEAHAAPADLVAAVLARAAERGLADPSSHLETEQPHPTDTHPPTRERIAALRPDLPTSLPANLLTAAAAAPPHAAIAGLAVYFADPAGLCRAATADFLEVVRRNDAAYGAYLEAAADIEPEERVLRENTRPGAIFFCAAGALFGACALALAAFGLPGLLPRDETIIAAVLAFGGVAMGGWGLFVLWRGERNFMLLRPERLAVPGLDRPIAWADIADFEMRWNYKRVVARFLLPPEAPFPQRLPGARRIKLDPKRRTVTISAVLPGKMTPQEFGDLLARYREAAEARRLLAERDAGVARSADEARHG